MKDSIRIGCDGTAMTPVTADVSIIVPTFNEADNVCPLVERLEDGEVELGEEVEGEHDPAVAVDHEAVQAHPHNGTGQHRDRPVRCLQEFAQRVVVMRAGSVEEEGPTMTTLLRPETEYTRRLIAAVPVPDPVLQRRRRASLGLEATA